MVVVDLDGTLVDCNSFTEFVRFIFRRYPGLRFRLGLVVLVRKIKFISHHQAKGKIVSLASRVMSDKDIDDFIQFLYGKVNNKVLEIIKGDDNVILATAAPEMYAAVFADKMGIGKVSSTIAGCQENKGARKEMDVREKMGGFTEKTIVITDHMDDLPLLRANRDGVNYLVKPSRRSLDMIRREGIRFILLD